MHFFFTFPQRKLHWIFLKFQIFLTVTNCFFFTHLVCFLFLIVIFVCTQTYQFFFSVLYFSKSQFSFLGYFLYCGFSNESKYSNILLSNVNVSIKLNRHIKLAEQRKKNFQGIRCRSTFDEYTWTRLWIIWHLKN